MRISLPGWRRSTLGIVTAVACASGIQITGCVRSSSHDVGADLSRRAAEAAIKAERAIADRNSRQPLFGSNVAKQDNSAVKKPAKKPVPRRSKPENPLAELLAARNDRYPAGDPFIESERPAEKTEKSFTEKTVVKQEEPIGRKLLSERIQLTQHESRSEVGSDGSRIARAMPTSQFSEEIAVYNHSKEIGRKEFNQSWSDDHGREPVNQPDMSGKFTKADPKTVAQSSKQTFSVEFAKSELGYWKDASSFSSSPVKRDSDELSATNVNQLVAHQEHVKALIKQSASQHSRGELHAAYRSALLASQLVEHYELELTENDVDPNTVAQEISAQIWGASRGNKEVVEALPEIKPKQSASELPLIRPRQMRSAKHDQVFRTPDSFLNWQASSSTDQDKNRVKKSTLVLKETTPDINQPVVSSPQQSQSEIRSALFSPAGQQTTSDQSLEVSSKTILQTASIEPSLETEDNWINVDAELLDESDSTNSATAIIEPASAEMKLAKPMPENFYHHEGIGKSQAKRSQPARGPLFAPIQEVNPFKADLEIVREKPVPVQLDQSEQAEVEPAQVKPQSRLKWGIVAFILATLSTLVGLKVNKTPATQAKQTKDEQVNNEDEHHLKISKAA